MPLKNPKCVLNVVDFLRVKGRKKLGFIQVNFFEVFCFKLFLKKSQDNYKKLIK